MECFLDKYKINSLDELYSYKIKILVDMRIK